MRTLERGRYGQDGEGEASCTGACAASYFCPAGSTTPLGSGECRAGYYCPTESATNEGAGPCPAGRYGGSGESTTECAGACAAGRYCESGSTTSQGTGPCEQGRFCSGGSTTAQGERACAAGKYCEAGTPTEVPCPSGRYCAEGSSTAQGTGACAAGRYCESGSTTSQGTGPCEQGRFCSGGSTTAQGERACAAGKYCEAGTSSEVPCPAGRYCAEGSATAQGTGACAAGRYCESGSTTSQGTGPCEQGRFCSGGSTTAQGERACAAGKYCEAGTPTEVPCPSGRYCAEGSATAQGTGACAAGRYCDSGSTTAQGTGPCEHGRFCSGGSTTAQGERACAAGKYCVAGTPSEVPCPAGRYCAEGSATAQGTGACAAGRFCESGSRTAQGSGACKAGFFCPAGSSTDEGFSGEWWAQQTFAKAFNADAFDWYGSSVALDGNTLAIGAVNKEIGARLSTITNDSSKVCSRDCGGAVYVYELSGATWTQQAFFSASHEGDWFGRQLALSADTLVVSAIGDSSTLKVILNGASPQPSDESAIFSGAVYVYTRSGTVWTQQAYIKAPNSKANALFGRSISLDGNTLAVGAPEDSSISPAYFAEFSVIDATGGLLFNASRGAATGRFNDTACVNELLFSSSNVSADEISTCIYVCSEHTGPDHCAGFNHNLNRNACFYFSEACMEFAPSADDPNAGYRRATASKSGAAYVFTRSGVTWTLHASIKAPIVGSGDEFGYSVALKDKTLTVGAPGQSSSQTTITNGATPASSDGAASQSGAVFVYAQAEGTTWIQQAIIKASNANESDRFGASVSLYGDTLAVGAERESGVLPRSGAAYVYVRSGEAMAWRQQTYIKASNAGANDAFGAAVSLHGDTLAVGAHGESSSLATVTNGPKTASSDDASKNSGAVYVYGRSGATSTWSQQAYLKASNAAGGGLFGVSLALTHGALATGAVGDSSSLKGFTAGAVVAASPDIYARSSGAAYIFNATTRRTICPAGRYGGVGAVSIACAGACKPGFFCPAGSATSEGAGTCAPGLYSRGGAGVCTACDVGYSSLSGAEVCIENSCGAITSLPVGVEGSGDDACTSGTRLTATSDPSCNVACKPGYEELPHEPTWSCSNIGCDFSRFVVDRDYARLGAVEDCDVCKARCVNSERCTAVTCDGGSCSLWFHGNCFRDDDAVAGNASVQTCRLRGKPLFGCPVTGGSAVTTFSCVDKDACDGNDACRSNGDTNATCVDMPPPSQGYSCSCTSGYREVDGSCVNIDACDEQTCRGDGDKHAVCVDRDPPREDFHCNCTRKFHPTGYRCTENVCHLYFFSDGMQGSDTGPDPCASGRRLSSVSDPTCSLRCKSGYVPAAKAWSCSDQGCDRASFEEGVDWDYLDRTSGGCDACKAKCSNTPQCTAVECGRASCLAWFNGACELVDSDTPVSTCRMSGEAVVRCPAAGGPPITSFSCVRTDSPTKAPTPSTTTRAFCPAGHYATLFESAQECRPCAAGHWCEDGATSARGSGECHAGYFCPLGSTDPRTRICAAGRFCVQGATSEALCPAGRYCEAGSASARGTGACAPSRYCEAGSKTALGSGPCAVGFHCPPGSETNTGSGRCIDGYVQRAGVVACSPTNVTALDGNTLFSVAANAVNRTNERVNSVYAEVKAVIHDLPFTTKLALGIAIPLIASVSKYRFRWFYITFSTRVGYKTPKLLWQAMLICLCCCFYRRSRRQRQAKQAIAPAQPRAPAQNDEQAKALPAAASDARLVPDHCDEVLRLLQSIVKKLGLLQTGSDMLVFFVSY